MANSIAAVKNYTTILDEVYQRAAVSRCLNSPHRMARAGSNAKEIMIPKIEVSELGNYKRNVSYKAGSITYEFETKTLLRPGHQAARGRHGRGGGQRARLLRGGGLGAPERAGGAEGRRLHLLRDLEARGRDARGG